MHDAHAHFSQEIVDLQSQHQIPSLYSVDSPKQLQIIQEHGLDYSIGVHPWNASIQFLEEMMPLLENAQIIGEIGMDSVWCDNDLNVQKEVFTRQIAYAASAHKPVVLHSKGQEKEILDILRQYPNTYFVHWYSCLDYVDDYNEVASYFSVGPSIGKDEAVTQLVKRIPIEKLLLESDGIDAIEWAIQSRDYLGALQHTIETIAQIKSLSIAETEMILDQNFKRLMQQANQ